MTTSSSSFSYVEVARNAGDGFWEVDLEGKKALFREPTHKLPEKTMVHDWTEVYQNITDYLTGTLPAPVHVKEIIAGRKYIFSNDPICSHSDTGTVAHNPNQKLHCIATATVIRAGRTLCNKHAGLDLNTSFYSTPVR